MKRSLFSVLFFVVCAVSIVGLVSCGGSAGGGGSADGTGDSSVLVATDFPNTGVCINGSRVVTSQTLIDMLRNATQVELQHKPYNNDDANIPFMCGLNAVWDPGAADAFGASTIFSTTTPVQDILGVQIGAIYMCNTGFGFQPGSAATAGLHEAETYRGELILTDALANQIRIRIRFTVSGADAGMTLAQLGLTGADFHLQDENGNDLTVVSEVLALFADNPGSVSAKLVASGVSLDLSTLGRIICWEQL